jgi:hypothetical protein
MAEAREKHAASVRSVRESNEALREKQEAAAAEIDKRLGVWRGKMRAYDSITEKLYTAFMEVEVPAAAARNAEHMVGLMAAFQAALEEVRS